MTVAHQVTASGRPVIGQVCHGSLGGSSRAAVRLVNALSTRGYETYLFAPQVLPWPLAPAVKAHCHLDAPRHRIDEPLRWDWNDGDSDTFARFLSERIAQERIDILHYHYALPFADIAHRIVRLMGPDAPTIIGTLHGTDLTKAAADPMVRSSLASALSSTDMLTTVSEFMAALASRTFLPATEPLVLPNFVEDDWPGTDTQTMPNRPTKPAILHVSNYRKVKQSDAALRVFVEIRKSVDAQLWCLGDGPHLAGLKSMADVSPERDAIHFLGPQAEPAPHFCAAQLLLSTSREESFGIAILEALAAGTPVAAFAVGGVGDLVHDEVTGLQLDPDDEHLAARRIAALLHSPDRLRYLQVNAQAHVAPLRESRILPLYERAYETALALATTDRRFRAHA